MNSALKILFILMMLAGAGPAARAQCAPDAEAAKQPAPPDGFQAKLYAARREKMAVIDANCDGVIQRQEWLDYLANRFRASDSDGDGRLSAGEQQAMIAAFSAATEENAGAGTVIRHDSELEIALKKMDANHDGYISKDEYIAWYNGRFDAMDKNNDGVLGIDEFQADFEGIHRHR